MLSVVYNKLTAESSNSVNRDFRFSAGAKVVVFSGLSKDSVKKCFFLKNLLEVDDIFRTFGGVITKI